MKEKTPYNYSSDRLSDRPTQPSWCFSNNYSQTHCIFMSGDSCCLFIICQDKQVLSVLTAFLLCFRKERSPGDLGSRGRGGFQSGRIKPFSNYIGCHHICNPFISLLPENHNYRCCFHLRSIANLSYSNKTNSCFLLRQYSPLQEFP